MSNKKIKIYKKKGGKLYKIGSTYMTADPILCFYRFGQSNECS